jgi:succinate dehydrogenase/fumarate reductase flavoprotein subunit
MKDTESGGDYDVVVLGGGGSGFAAAIEAAENGRSVVLLEKNVHIGGTTARSVGSITASGTRLQREAGVSDSVQAHFEDMGKFAGELEKKDNLALRRLYVEQAAATVDWLENLGVVFIGPNPEPPHRVPRMHNVLPHSRSFLFHLAARARSLGVKIVTGVRADSLITSAGRISGVVAVGQSGEKTTWKARLGVVLACGDFSSGKEMKSQFLSESLARVEGINPDSTGDGQRLGVAAGGEVVNGEVVWGPEIRFVAPPKKKLVDLIPPYRFVARLMRKSLGILPQRILRPFLMMFITTNLAPSHSLFKEGAILVNKQGNRFVDELNRPQDAIPNQPDRIAYIVFDESVAKKFSTWPFYISTAPGVAYAYLADYARNRQDVFCKADSLAELEQKIGFGASSLANAVNEQRGGGGPKPSLGSGPFYALGPVKSWLVFSDGGLRVNEQLQVLDASGSVISGLFAAGSTGQGGLILEGHGHHLGWAFTSGRIAGRNAATLAA